MKKWHLWLAASIGLVVIAGMMIREFDVEALSRIDLSPRFFLGVVMGVLLFAVQNLMLTLRFRHLCQRKLSIAQGFRINVLCEFTSAVTPSAVGGSGLAFVYLNREGISMGRSIFTMFAALLADEAFLAISCLLLYFCVPSHLLFSLADEVGISADATNEWIKGGVQKFFIPARIHRHAVVRNDVRLFLGFGEVVCKDTRHLSDAFLLGGNNTTVTGNYAIVTVDDNRIDEAELTKRGAELIDLLWAVCPGVVDIRHQLCNGNELHLGRCFHQTTPHSANFSKPPTERM